jgi:hypothetical protein
MSVRPPAVPSRHTSGFVAGASVLHEFYGLKVDLPAYTITGVVTGRMRDEDDHWAGNMLFGATLGWVVGDTVTCRHAALEIASFAVLPYLGRPEAPTVDLYLARAF